MTYSVSLRAYTGANAGTQSAALAAVTLLSADTASTNPASAEVDRGTYSYERWLRVLVDSAGGQTFTNFWVERVGDLPDGVTIRLGVTDTPATPRNTASLVATHTMAERRYFFDDGAYDADGQATRYLVIQEQVAADADPGAIEQQVFTIGYTTA